MGVLYFSRDAETAVSQSVSQFPQLSLCHDNRKIVSGGQKPILAVSWPTSACIWQCWHVEVSTGWSLGGNSGSQ
jgi:hypothetical protein